MPPDQVKESAESSRAFVEQFEIEPTGIGPLSGLTFAVKDVIDIAGRKTSYGNPDWGQHHPAPVTHAICVDQLLSAGAQCLGKTAVAELAMSLTGENPHYGTPKNYKVPERVPGGSSSGSASAVAGGFVDFALGTDSGGSVRIPASYCGLFGMRPSPGSVSVSGVLPFTPFSDTVGILAQSAPLLAHTMAVLQAVEIPKNISVNQIHLLEEAFDLADSSIQEALNGAVTELSNLTTKGVVRTSLKEIVGNTELSTLDAWGELFMGLQLAEIWSTFGTWVVNGKPNVSESTGAIIEKGKDFKRETLERMLAHREALARQVEKVLHPQDLLCIPTSPVLAPVLNSLVTLEDASKYMTRTLRMTSISCIAKLPEISLPLAHVNGAPVGLSLLAAPRQDAFLLSVAQSF